MWQVAPGSPPRKNPHPHSLCLLPEKQMGLGGNIENHQTSPRPCSTAGPGRGGHDKIVGSLVSPGTCLLRADKIEGAVQSMHTLTALQGADGVFFIYLYFLAVLYAGHSFPSFLHIHDSARGGISLSGYGPATPKGTSPAWHSKMQFIKYIHDIIESVLCILYIFYLFYFLYKIKRYYIKYSVFSFCLPPLPFWGQDPSRTTLPSVRLQPSWEEGAYPGNHSSTGCFAEAVSPPKVVFLLGYLPCSVGLTSRNKIFRK